MNKLISICLLFLVSKCQSKPIENENSEKICVNEKILNFASIETVTFQMTKPVDPFIGREKEINEIKASYEEENKPIVITGLKGIGKSELVRKYAMTFKEENLDGSTIWLDASSLDNLIFSFQELSNFVGISTEDKVPSDIIKDIFIYFNNKKVLFIFDNAPSDIFVLNNLNRFRISNLNNYIILTSRDKNWNSKFKTLQLNVFPLSDSIDFFNKNLHLSQENETDAKNLANLLNNIPLVLCKVAKYIKDREDDYSLKDFLDEYTEINMQKVNTAIEDAIKQEQLTVKLKEDKNIYEELGLRPTQTVIIQKVRPPTRSEIKDAVKSNIEKEASRIAQRIRNEVRRTTSNINNFFKRLRNDVAG